MENLNRRDVMRGGALAAAGLAVGAAGLAHAQEGMKAHDFLPKAFDKEGRATLPPLAYEYDALDAAIDEQTMRLHHDKHHQGYVNGYNSALDALQKARSAGDFGQVDYYSRKLAFHGAGHALHSIFWDVMSPDGGGEPSGELAKKIEKDFGSFSSFRDHFVGASKSVEGSGWGLVVLHLGSKQLLVQQAMNHQQLSTWVAIPILVIDVWEHAYYLRYQNNRGEYVNNFLNVVDWGAVGQRLERALAMAG